VIRLIVAAIWGIWEENKTKQYTNNTTNTLTHHTRHTRQHFLIRRSVGWWWGMKAPKSHVHVHAHADGHRSENMTSPQILLFVFF
jgi:hypothetical protein